MDDDDRVLARWQLALKLGDGLANLRMYGCERSDLRGYIQSLLYLAYFGKFERVAVKQSAIGLLVAS